ncbi:MAG: hypothetical protein M3Y29_02580 [Chloroflexota bacterium]|jgi:hypothetical protein|nr:hypothetical protein [Chloroflexota bacterium]
MHLLLRIARWLVARLSALLVVVALLRRVRRALGHRSSRRRDRRNDERSVLPSLYDVHPGATTSPRRALGLRSVPLDRIVGTMRRPSQNTGDFLPLPRLRGANWRARWQRINRAMDRLAMLPPVELVQVGDEYYVADGHNRVAAARLAGAVEIDADVTQLLVPGVTPSGETRLDASTLVGAEEVRQAGSGHFSRTVEQRTASDEVTRKELLRDTEETG